MAIALNSCLVNGLLQSGQVTAGVLRGENMRFQLFGDTMNTCSRMESNGIKNRIHVSKETADLVIAAGKEKWIMPREEKIYAKGKGDLQTFWLDMRKARQGSCSGSNTSDAESDVSSKNGNDILEKNPDFAASEKIRRHIEWNVKLLMQLLKQIAARRQAQGLNEHNQHHDKALPANTQNRRMVIDEVAEVICLPHFDSKCSDTKVSSIDLGPKVVEQLRLFITKIGAGYHSNPCKYKLSHIVNELIRVLWHFS